MEKTLAHTSWECKYHIVFAAILGDEFLSIISWAPMLSLDAAVTNLSKMILVKQYAKDKWEQFKRLLSRNQCRNLVKFNSG